MITKEDKKIITHYAKEYNVSIVYLFGSSTIKNKKANDIDLGVKGLQKKLFFKFYGHLIKDLSKPVDLVDLSDKSLFNNLVEENGIKIYG